MTDGNEVPTYFTEHDCKSKANEQVNIPGI